MKMIVNQEFQELKFFMFYISITSKMDLFQPSICYIPRKPSRPAEILLLVTKRRK